MNDTNNKTDKVIGFRKGVFVIVEDNECPLYNIGEEVAVEQNWVTMPIAKSTCLILAQDIAEISTEELAYEHQGLGDKGKVKFVCSGCSGTVSFEYKKEKEYTTLPMKLLAATERKEKIQVVSNVADRLGEIDLFKPLSTDDLVDLTTLLIMKDYSYGFPICQQGDPGTHLYIILGGRVEVLDEDGTVLSEMITGDVFGEMSLLSGDRVSTTIMAAEPCEIATLNQKNFKHILNKFPSLQIFLYRLVVRRITAINAQRAEELASGMTGQVVDFPLVELCQMINSNRKTGRLKVEHGEQKAFALFDEGELIYAEVGDRVNKEAFYDLLAIKVGRFRFSQGLTTRERRLDAIGGFMGMLMEGIKRQDDLNDS